MKNLSLYKKNLIKQALNKNPGCKLLPCGTFTHLDQCFTIMDNKVLFWFNTNKNKSTQMLYVSV